MGGHILFLVAIIGVWATLLLLLGVLAAREAVDWWYRRRQHGRHHPVGPKARTVDEIQRRLWRESSRSRRHGSIAVRRRGPPGG